MKTRNHLIKKWLIYVFMLINTLLLLDFLIPGRQINSEIFYKEKKEQRYFNAAQNSHYSYTLHTEEHLIVVDESSFDAITVGDSLYYKRSFLFAETNSYTVNHQSTRTHSLRRFSGLYFPVMGLVIMVLGLAYRKKVDILVFVGQVMTVLNLLYCIQ